MNVMRLTGAHIKRVAAAITILLVGVLFFASSRKPYTLSFPTTLREEGKRPKPSRQNVPSDPLRALGEASEGRRRYVTPAPTVPDAPASSLGFTGRGALKALHVADATTRPGYLDLFTPSESHSFLPPPL